LAPITSEQFSAFKKQNAAIHGFCYVNSQIRELPRGVWIDVSPLGFSNLKQIDPLTALNSEHSFEVNIPKRAIRVQNPMSIIVGDITGEINSQIRIWNKSLPAAAQGKIPDSSAQIIVDQFGSYRSPDVGWISKAAMANLLQIDKKRKRLDAIPEFVVEVRSAHDSLTDSHDKMCEWIEYFSVESGFLVDPFAQQTIVYCSLPHATPMLNNVPAQIAASLIPGGIQDPNYTSVIHKVHQWGAHHALTLAAVGAVNGFVLDHSQFELT